LVEDDPSASAVDHNDPQAATKSQFAERLRAAMERKGWTVADTARHVSRLLGEEAKFGSSHISGYLSGRALPRVKYLQALSRALEVQPEELLPGQPSYGDLRQLGGHDPETLRGEPQPPSASPVDLVHVRDYGDGTALLQVLQRVPWATALEIMALVKGDSKKGE
jgi:transcriptional regulator with XRE-family HTH domain